MAEFIHKINDNDTLYRGYLEHKLTGTVSNVRLATTLGRGPFGLDTDLEHPIPGFECYVCRAVYEKTIKTRQSLSTSIYQCPPPAKTNDWYSLWQNGKCQVKVFREFVAKGVNFTKGQFEREWLKYFKHDNCDLNW